MPVPATVAEHWLVCPVWMEIGAQETVTDVMVADGGGVLPPPPLPPPPQPDRASKKPPKRRIEAANLPNFIVQDEPIWGMALEGDGTLPILHPKMKSGASAASG